MVGGAGGLETGQGGGDGQLETGQGGGDGQLETGQGGGDGQTEPEDGGVAPLGKVIDTPTLLELFCCAELK